MLLLDGETLSPEDMDRVARGEVRVDLSKTAWDRVRAGRGVINKILESGKVAYGINTGFGVFSNVVIDPKRLTQYVSTSSDRGSGGVCS